MFECNVCGLLSLRGPSCPACGSQLRTDLSASMHDEDFVPTEVPGLEEAADSWYDLEGMERPAEADGEPQAPPVVGTLPFGFQGESQTYRPNLPFGIGSFAQGMPFSQGEALADEQVGSPQPVPSRSSLDAPVMQHQPKMEAPLTAVAPKAAQARDVRSPRKLAPGEQTSVPLPGRSPAGSMGQMASRATPRTGEVERVPLPTQAAPLTPASTAPEPAAEPTAEPAPSSVGSAPLPRPSTSTTAMPPPAHGAVDTGATVRLSSARLVTPSASSETPAPHAEVQHEPVDVPEYWKVDAPIPDYTELYGVGEQVVEVVHEHHEADVVVYDHEEPEASAVFHSPLEASLTDAQSSGLRLKLHPAQALAVEVEGHPEHTQWLQDGYRAMASASWGQAARAFQQLAGQRPNDATVLNNYGIALLQRAIAMAEAEGDAEHPTVAAQFESAILALREAAKNSPTNGDVLVNLAHALVESGRSEKALGIINVHLSRQPTDTKGLNTQAVAMARLGQMAQALDVLKRIQGDAIASENLVQFTG